MQKITLIGRLGRDAAVRETQDGGKMISFTMAVNGIFRGVEKTYWYDVVSFNYSRYKNMAKYLTKGSSVAVTGDLDADIEEGRDGEYRCRRNVTADSIEFNSNGTSGSTASDSTVEERPRRRQRTEEPEDISDEDLQMSQKPKRRSRDEEDEEPRPKRRSRDEDEEEAPVTRTRKRDAEDEEDEPKPKRRSRDEEEDEPKPKRRNREEEDGDEEETPRRARKAKNEDEDGEDNLPF